MQTDKVTKTYGNLPIFGVMASFLEDKAKEHKCKATDLNIGYSDGEVYLYKTYYCHDDRETKVAWEQDLKTGEIITD